MKMAPIAFGMEVFLSLALLVCFLEYFSLRKEFNVGGLFFKSVKKTGGYHFFQIVLLVAFLAAILLSFYPPIIALLLLVELYFVYHFKGSFNGGSGYMCLALLLGLCVYEYAPFAFIKKIGLLYVGTQCLLSFIISGFGKLKTSGWRDGTELKAIMQLPAYSVPKVMVTFFSSRQRSFIAAWLIILFELLLPIGFVNQPLALIMIFLAIIFNFFNTIIFGLNRFLFFWLAAYPALFFCFTQLHK